MAKIKNQTTQEVIEKEVAKTPEAQKSEEEAKELVQLVIFELDKEEYAVDISGVREILRVPEVTPIPNSPNFIEGIINVRGKIVVVMDMEERFNLERESKKKSLHVLLTEIGNSTFGAIVDEVTEVLRIPKESIEEAPAIISEKIHAEYVKGIVVLEDRLIILLDFAKVFEEKGLIELSQLIGKQAKIAQTRRVTDKQEETEETKAEHKAKIEELAKERIKGVKPAFQDANSKQSPAPSKEEPKEPEEKVEELQEKSEEEK
ncbi:MAG: chemotaxis protein CheW [Minisyncoccales bacterium]